MDKLSVLFCNQSKLDTIYYVLRLAQYTTHICIFCKFTLRKNIQGCSFRRNRKLGQDKSFSFDNKKKKIAFHYMLGKILLAIMLSELYIVKDRELNALYKCLSKRDSYYRVPFLPSTKYTSKERKIKKRNK